MVKTIRKYKADEERTLLAAMILHTPVLEQIALHTAGNPKPFRSKWSNVIAGWCLEHFAQYQKAPRKAVRNLFTQYAAASRDEEAVETIETFLVGLSEEFSDHSTQVNKRFLVDLASRHFQKIQLERMAQNVLSALDKNDVEDAESCRTSYSGKAFASSDWIDPTQPEVILKALQDTEGQSLIQFRGDLGTFLSPHFERDGFIAFVGPEKRGKSYWLLEVVWQALIQRRRVLYYIVGDMSERQVIRRLITRAIRRPLRSGSINRPISIVRQKKGGVDVEIDPRSYPEPVSQSKAVHTMKDLLKKTGTKISRLKMRCVGGNSLSASDIERDVYTLSHSGWIPDVVVIDYSDLLASELTAKNLDFRHQINASWMILRRIASDNHLLLVTATQAAASSYGANTIKKSDFSEDKRKNAHVTGMLGINQTAEEKSQGVYRLNWVFLRDGGWSDYQVVWTAGCLGVACPAICSTL